MMRGRIILVTGPPGAGKTTVARSLADRLSPSVHLQADQFWRAIRQGYVAPFLPEAHEQNRVVVDLVGAAATGYALGGYEVVLDGIVGPWFLDRVLNPAAAAGVALHYIVLRPGEAVALARAVGRVEADELRDETPVRKMHAAFADLGEYERYVIDSSTLAPEQTVSQIMRSVAQDSFLLPASGSSVVPEHEVRFERLTYQEISQRAGGGAIVVAPFGCTEQQGPHLAVGFDTWFAEELCVAAAQRAHQEHGIDCLVAPVIPFGPTPEHRNFGAGYVDLPRPVHDEVCTAVLISLAEQGFHEILVWRGCGGHDLSTPVQRFNREWPGRAQAHLPDHSFQDVWCRFGDVSVPGGHADSFTTSVALHLHPELVRPERVPGPSAEPNWTDPRLDFRAYSDSGVIGDPTHADAELGAALWDECVKVLAMRLVELTQNPDQVEG